MSDDTPRAAWPDGFVWGTSTSSYQIEGDVACDHYHRYREDVALMRSLGVDAYRFSVAWSRVLPRGRGEVNPKGLDFYDRLTDELMTAGVEPWLCLYHWDLPQAIQDTGGWGTRDTAGWFEDYAALMTRRLGDRVKRWATFNEFSVFTLFGYAMDWAPPGRSDRDAHLQAIHHVNPAHGAGVEVIRSGVLGARIGAIHNRQPVIAVNDTEADRAAAAMLDTHWNQVFPEAQLGAAYPAAIAQAIESHVRPGDMARICRPIDWIGLNHYGPIFARADERSPWGFAWADAPDGDERTEIGWSIRPDLFRDELMELSRRYRLPVYVTENGCGGTDGPAADGSVDDPERIRYLDRYTDAMREAIGRGADVRGYFVWSLLDNFEWGAGYGNRFGLVHVDYASQKRTPKSSARWYARLIAASRRSRSHTPTASWSNRFRTQARSTDHRSGAKIMYRTTTRVLILSTTLAGCAAGEKERFAADTRAVVDRVARAVSPAARAAGVAANQAAQRMKGYLAEKDVLKTFQDAGAHGEAAVLAVLRKARTTGSAATGAAPPMRPEPAATPAGAPSRPPGEAGEIGSSGEGGALPGGSRSTPAGATAGTWRWPVDAGIISSEYGHRRGRAHRGIDIAARTGEPVLASTDGDVIYSGNGLSGYGNVVILRHADDMTTLYAHNSELRVRTGERIAGGSLIALLGNTGRSTGPHVHYEVRRGEIALDPRAVLPPTKLAAAFAAPLALR